jgi:ech hydrogenase subunit A
MNPEILVAVNVGLPAIAALFSLVLDNKRIRSLIVYITAISLIASSMLMYRNGQLFFSPSPIFEKVVIALDFGLLLYFLYIGYRSRSWLVSGLGLLQLIPVTYFEFILKGAHVEHIMVVDNLSNLFTLIISIVGSAVLVYALSYMDEHEKHLQMGRSGQNRFFFFMILLLGAMNGLVYSNSLYWLYFFWEITTLCCYALIRHDGTDEACENSILALWMGLVGGVAFVIAMFVGYNAIHSIALTDLIAANNPLLVMVFSLLALAAFTKSAQFPFHSWLLGAMVAPTPVSALLHSSTMVNAGIYMLLRVVPAIQGTSLTYIIAAEGALTFVVTSILAIRQNISKRILAFSTIGNLGLIILCIGLNTGLGYSAAVTLLIFHSVAKGMLFLGAGIIENRVHTRDIEEWEGLLGKLPLTTTAMILGMVSMFLPPFGMLLGKWVAVDAVATAPLLYSLPIAVLIVIGSAATTFYYAKWLGYLTIMPRNPKPKSEEKLQTPYKVSIIALLGINVTVSVGIAFVIRTLVNPLVGTIYPIVLETPWLNIDIGLSYFPTWPLWIAGLSVIIIGTLLAKSKGGTITTPYLSGENVINRSGVFMTTADDTVEAEISGIYLDNEISESFYDRLAVYGGTILVILMFVMEVI